jgi:hypothetical protein
MHTGIVFQERNRVTETKYDPITQSGIDSIIETKCVPHNELHLFMEKINKWDVLFLVHGESHEKIKAIVESVAIAARNQIVSPNTVSPPNTDPSTHYVYAYFQNSVLDWKNCFYIGKGKRQRLTIHVNHTLTFPHSHYTRKHRQIKKWLISKGLQHSKAPVAQSNALAHGLVCQLQFFLGTYAAAQAYYVEYFLISHVVGTYSVENETNGNRKNNGCIAIARSAGLDTKNPNHVSVWDKTIDEFIRNPNSPTINNLWLPATRLLISEYLVPDLDLLLEKIGLVPQDMMLPGMNIRNIPDIEFAYAHMAVKGAADATLTYRFRENYPPYRIEIKISATALTAVINVRKLNAGRAGNLEFIEYFNKLLLKGEAVNGASAHVGKPLSDFYTNQAQAQNVTHDFIRYPGDPFYKPFALDAIGRNDACFNLVDLSERTLGQTNWINGKNFDLSLLEAIELITKAFICPQ